ncbi:MAG: ATP-binding protein [Steroidobacteraceae bacterium]
MPADAPLRIFDPFEQADGAAQHSRSGLGVGLAPVREFVKLHGGSVKAHSAGPGRGSELTVHLPTEAESVPVTCGTATATTCPGIVRIVA